MRVRIDGQEYEVDRNCNTIELELNYEDKTKLSSMAPDTTHYFVFNELGERYVAARIDELDQEKLTKAVIA